MVFECLRWFELLYSLIYSLCDAGTQKPLKFSSPVP